MSERYMTSDELNELKSVEVELLDELDRVCKILNIPYFMVGGTLLGAVRHKGFIPWDDDIDVVMFRKDLDKLEKEGKNYFYDKYFFQSANTDKHYPLMTAKLRKNNTRFLECCMDSDCKSNCGIFIDVFPMDDISDVKSKKIKRRAKAISFITTVICENCGYKYGASKKMTILSKCIGLFGVGWLKKLRHKLMTSENNCGLPNATIYASNYGYVKQCRDKSVYLPPTELEFEGKKYLAPHNYKAFLRQLFGDNYMDLPPVEERVTRHPISELSFGSED